MRGKIAMRQMRQKGADSARGEDVELIALGVGEARPRHVALAKVDVGGAESPQPVHLRRLIITGVRPEVEMDAVLHGLQVGVRMNSRYGPTPLAERSTACSSVTECTVQSIASPQNRPMARGSAQSATIAAIGPVSR